MNATRWSATGDAVSNVINTRAPVHRLGESDCEELRDGLLTQPVATVTSVAYIVAGVWLIRHRPAGERASQWLAQGYSVAVVFVGVGSIAFHGPQWWAARWLHDVPIVVALAAVPCWDLAQSERISPRRAWWCWLGVTVLVAVVAAAVPEAALLIGLPVGLAAIAGELMVRRELRTWAPMLAVGTLGAVVNLLGRTGAPLCEPESVVQLHGAWHLLTATAFFLWGRGAFPAPPQVERGEVAA